MPDEISATESETWVRPFLRAVANGCSESGKLKVTLIATPEPARKGDPLAIPLETWPSSMAALLRGGLSCRGNAIQSHAVEIGVAMIVGCPPQPDEKAKLLTGRAIGHDKVESDRDWDEVDKLWHASIDAGAVPRVWDRLRRDIERSLTAKKHQAALQDYSPPADAPPESEFDKTGAIKARRPKSNDLASIQGIISIKQGSFALDEERVRAQRVLTKIHRGPYYICDEIAPDVGEEPGGTEYSNEQMRKDAHEKKIRQNKFDELKQSIQDTRADRKASERHFKEIKDLICKADLKDVPDLNKARKGTPDRSVVAEPDDVTDGRRRADRRAGHKYGTWLQRGRDADCQTVYRAEQVDDLTRDQATAFERVRSVYYSFQGDTLLSRLFCLAIDLEIEDGEQQVEDGLLLLTVESEKEVRPTTLVRTAASLVRSTKQFWPVSRFEVSLGNLLSGKEDDKKRAASSYIDQRSGVWNLGAGHAPEAPDDHAPRYDLISLDIRRAIDANPLAADRGQRHLTAGFTIIDADRSRQIARDMAIAADQASLVRKQCDKANGECEREEVVLYAEELTIGRRVDVAIGQPGSDVAGLEWRSLMHRAVDFPNVSASVNAVLSALQGDRADGKGFREESSFQVAARFMPKLTSDSSSAKPANEVEVEAVAEEAVYVWDGTPAAVLTSETGRIGDEPVACEDLPFKRHQSPLTTGTDRKLCPPPLRYGVPYVFALRSTFLGGGSPSVEQAGQIHRNNQGAFMLPPAIENRVAPRRFLRHESICAPKLLLPVHLVESSYGAMGYELLDSAVVRSVTRPDQLRVLDPCVAVEKKKTGPEGLPRVPVKDRACPAQTMRVFVPPAVPLDTVARHRLLDRDSKDVLKVLRGGLLDVAFDHKNNGFPVAVTKRAPAFNRDQAIYGRELSQSGANGAAVFEPGGKNTANPGGCGYLPDPAAEEMVLRLRIRGSDRYLQGFASVEIHEGEIRHCYPKFLPLVVSIRRQSTVRNAPATNIGEIVTGDPKAVYRLQRNGDITSQSKRGGTRVRHLIVTLAPGEDYDLEVVCLPTVNTLACSFSLPETMAIQLAASAKQPGRYGAALETLCGSGVCDGLAAPTKEDAQKLFIGLGGNAVPCLAAVKQTAGKLLEAIKSCWPIEELAAVTRLRVCHAINAPLTEPEWGDVKIKRPRTLTKDNFYNVGSMQDAPRSTTALLTGTLRLDLEQSDAFEIAAQTVASSGNAIDDPVRSRSLTARRSGRWPKLTLEGGKRRYVSTRDVVGFHVTEDGRVTLPEEVITLLRVDNLPCRGPASASAAVQSPIRSTTRRLTEVDLGLLHAAALGDGKIDLPIGDVDLQSSCNPDKRVRTLRTAKPAILTDAKARKLTLRAVALSRYAETFETTPRYVDGKEPLLGRRQALEPEEQSRSGQETVVWVPATERPAKCAPKRPAPTFVIERRAELRENGVVRQHLERRALTRLYFERGWFSSGEGERVGIVLWPPRYFTQSKEKLEQGIVHDRDREMTLATFEDGDLGPGGFFTTRWGGDPIRKDEMPEHSCFIPRSAFVDYLNLGSGPHRPCYVPSALMPVPKSEEPKKDDAEVADSGDDKEAKDAGVASESSEGFLEVSLLTYEPCFDLDREEWYVDVDLRPTRATDPFIRFGLVRYQENSISDELKLSEPVTVWGQILPKRELALTCTAVDRDLKVEVELKGQASSAIKPLDFSGFAKTENEREKLRQSFNRLQRSQLKLMLVHEAEDDVLCLRTPVFSGEPMTADPPTFDGWQMRWALGATIPAQRREALGRGAYIAYLEEIEERMPASYPREPVTPRDMFDCDTFRSSGPRFSARVAFFDDIGGMCSSAEGSQSVDDERARGH